MNIAIIPARGGSKRIPNKNIIDFNGKPMITYTIEAAKATNLFHKIVVSTDSESIAEISTKYGAEVPFLRECYADDNTPVSIATIDSLNRVEAYYNLKYETVIQLMANCPLRDKSDIMNGYNYFEKENIDFLISCFKFGWMNPWWAYKLNKENLPQALFPEALKSRSQDLPDLYCPTGAMWIAKSNKLKEAGTFYGERFHFFPLSLKSSIDIDNYEDIDFAMAYSKL